MVRRASLSDRHNLCRKEYETEAIVWRGGREEEKEKESDQESKPVLPVSMSEAPLFFASLRLLGFCFFNIDSFHFEVVDF